MNNSNFAKLVISTQQWILSLQIFTFFPEYLMRILWRTPGCHLLSWGDWSIKIWQRRPGARLGPGVTWDMGWWGLTCHDGRMVWPGAPVISVITNMMRCDQDWDVIWDTRDSGSVIDDARHWSVFPSCLKWSASDALINLFSFGWFCLISNGGSLHWEHTVIRIKLDLLTFYTWYVHQHSIYHRLRVSKHQFIKSSCC